MWLARYRFVLHVTRDNFIRDSHFYLILTLSAHIRNKFVVEMSDELVVSGGRGHEALIVLQYSSDFTLRWGRCLVLELLLLLLSGNSTKSDGGKTSAKTERWLLTEYTWLLSLCGLLTEQTTASSKESTCLLSWLLLSGRRLSAKEPTSSK